MATLECVKMLSLYVQIQQMTIFFSFIFFFEKMYFDISYKLSKETICMNC